MKKIKIKDICLDKHHFNELYVFYDDNNELVLLPLLFSIHLCKTGEVFVDKIISTRDRKKNSTFVTEKMLTTSSISNNTISTYLGHLLTFLQYIEDQTLSGDSLINETYDISDEFLNYFLNFEYPQRVSTLDSVHGMESALKSYFNFLTYLGVNTHKSLKIDRNTKRLMLEKESKNFQIKYIRSSYISSLLLNCESISDELIIKFGYELGLRASECAGIMLNGIGGLSDLVTKYEMEQEAIKTERFAVVTSVFDYVLRGRYTKGGKSRVLYIPRTLMGLISRYKNTERKDLLELSAKPEANSLMLCPSNSHLGLPISKKYATTLFRRLKAKVKALRPFHTFHCLRHTFATRLYDERLKAGDGKNDALLHVAIKLGHALSAKGNFSQTTIRYILMRNYMLSVEEAA